MDGGGVFDAGDDLGVAAAGVTGFDVEVEYALQAPGPGHGSTALGLAEEYDMERYVRDLICMPILGGNSNMQRNNIAGRLRLASD